MKNWEKHTVVEQVMAHSSDMAFVLDLEGRFVQANAVTCRNLGRSESELHERFVYQFFQVKAGDTPFTFKDQGKLTLFSKEVILNNNGSRVPVFCSSLLLTEEKLVVCILGPLQQQSQPLCGETRFRSLFDSNPDIMVYQDKAGVIMDVNPSFLEFFNLPSDLVINKQLYDFMPLEVVPIFWHSLQQAFCGEKVNFETDAVFEGKGLKVLRVVKVPVEIEGKVSAVHAIIRDVTDEVLAKRTAQQQAAKLNTIFESITDAFFTLDKDWRITYVNNEFEQMLQINRKEAVGKIIWEVFTDETHNDFQKYYNQAAETGHSVQFEAYSKHMDIWVEVKVFPSEEGLSVYFDNITERVKAKAELEKLSLVASKTTNSVIITDAQGLTEWVNQGFTNMTGYTLEEMLGKKPGAVLQGPETDLAAVKRASECLKSAKPFKEELLNYKKSGEKFWIHKDVTPIFDKEGELVRFIAIQSDITERKKDEAKLVNLAEDLYRHNSDLEQFTYIISHNLRSPVANAQGLITLLQGVEAGSDLFNVALNHLKQSVDRLDGVLRDVNEILSIRGTKGTVILEQINLQDIWEQVLVDLQDMLLDCNGQVQTQIEPNLIILANRAYLYSILHNLLSNAIKYRSEKRVLIVNLQAESNASGVVIKFSDNGSGFNQKKAEGKIFKLYHRFHTQKEGKGIGLFLVKSHVDAMGGQIQVSSQIDQGTTFTIYFNKDRRSLLNNL